MKKPSPAAAKRPVIEPKGKAKASPSPPAPTALPSLDGERDYLISEEMEFRIKAGEGSLVVREYVILLSHLRDMYSILPEEKTFGVISKFKEPGKDRTGPRFKRLRELVEEKGNP